MQDTAKDFLKSAFWSEKKWLIERLTLGGDWTKDCPFILRRDEINNYVWDEYIIMKFLYKNYYKVAQRLCEDNWKNTEEIDIVYLDGVEVRKTIYFDLSEVF